VFAPHPSEFEIGNYLEILCTSLVKKFKLPLPGNQWLPKRKNHGNYHKAEKLFKKMVQTC